jgi:hypothetical protein
MLADRLAFGSSLQNISFSPILRSVLPRSLTAGPMTSSGCFSTVFLFMVSPQTPFGSNRLFVQIAYVQLETLHMSSVHLHQTPSWRFIVAFFVHLKASHV